MWELGLFPGSSPWLWPFLKSMGPGHRKKPHGLLGAKPVAIMWPALTFKNTSEPSVFTEAGSFFAHQAPDASGLSRKGAGQATPA